MIIALSESEGLRVADDVSPDGVVVRDNASQLHGLNLCRRIRHLFDLPLILLGDKPEEEVYPSTFKAGADWDYYMRSPAKCGGASSSHKGLAVALWKGREASGRR